MTREIANSEQRHLGAANNGRKTLEGALADIWAGVLQLPYVDKDANFFELGGDSLKALDVIVRVSELLHVDLPLIAFFEQPTIRHLAEVLSGGPESTEVKLAKIWEEVLRAPQVGTEANFFDIGGDSLKAMDVIVRVSEVLQVDLPLIAFFEEPTVVHLAAVIDELKSAGTTPAITRVADRHEFPLAYSQQVWWLLEQQNPETGIYNKPRIFRIRGTVDPEVMERSLDELRQRHEILRVRFVSGVDGPMQVVEEGGSLQFAVTDLSSEEPHRREWIAMKLALETVRKPLQLCSGEVQRALLMQLSSDEFILCISEHHVVNDGFTGSILLDELGAIYDAFAVGEANPLPPLELHYTDYAVWERQWMQGERLAGEIEYWRSILSDAPTSVELPTDSSTSQEPDRRGRLRSMTVPPASLQRLQASAQANGTTQFTVLSAALRLLLYRWSGQADFLLGTTASNRSRSGTERMIGPFVNPLPIRNPIADGQSVLDLLNSEKKAVMEAFAHQDCPFAKIVEAVNPARTSNDNPLFNVGLVMENFPEIELKGRHFEAEYLNFDPETALLDLRFVAIEKHGGLRFSCEYKSALFSPETVDALLQAYADALDAITNDPAKRINEFRIPEVLARQVAASSVARQQRIAVAATYTAEPLKEPLEFWLRQLGMPPKIEFALFNQVFQQLLDPNSLLANNQYGANVVLVRMEDLHEANAVEAAKDLDTVVDELLAALRGAARRATVPYFILIGPPSESVRGQVELARAIERAEEKLVDGGREIEGVRVISSRKLLSLYPVAAYADDYSYQISHIPYRPALFNALATMIARCIHGARRVGHEVIVLDCNVLWSVAAADGGSPGTVVDAPHEALQDFMAAQENAGMILCLVGGDTEADISAKFEGTAGMSLGWQNFASSRLGARAKGDGLNGLADELGLALDRFIFVTNDPIDAAEVRANCPSVVVAELPADADSIPAFLANFWGFDRCVETDAPRFSLHTQVALLNRVAAQFTNVDAITQAIEVAKVRRGRESHAYAPPRSPVEEFLADVWVRLLRVERPSIHDNFFALGGHSLMAAQVIARVRQTLGVELPLRAMFEAPTIAGFAGLIEMERRARSGVVVPPITRVPREGALPLSFAQQRLWFIDQLEPGSALYNLASMYRMRGKLNVPALGSTINEIVRRHESLRTTFRNVEGHPMSVVAAELVVPVPLAEVAGEDEHQREAELRGLALAEATQPFDLAAGPLFRARLLRVGEDDHALLIVVHHIVGDGWSGSLIAGEMAAIYGAFVQDSPSPLPELAIQYADFAVWQRQWLQGDVQDRQVDYWRHQLAGAPAVLEHPTDRPRPAVQSHRGDVRTHVIPKQLVERLTVLSQNDGATLFMTLLAGFQVLLARYSGQEDVVVGSPIAGRNHAEIEPLIGFFVNTLPLRADLSGNPTFRELLARVKQVALDGYAHQELPFEKLVEELQPQRSLSYNPVFQVLFGLQNMPRRYFEASGLSVERSSIHQATSILDMSWFVFPAPDGLLLRVEFDTDLFDGSTIERMIGHYQTMLEGIVVSPESHIVDLPLLTEAEERKILIEFNQTAADFLKGDLLHDFAARQAKATPEATALIVADERLTYRELNARANQLAHHLVKRGAGPEVLVGIYSERSADMLVGILGILKSGSAYVPLDPNYPQERIRYILEDAKAPLVVTHSSIANELPDFAGERICLDKDWPVIAQEPATNPASIANPENLAYVLFTSGSTGRPKGVAIEHRSAATFVHWARGAFDPKELAGVLFSTSMCFDLSVFELFVPLSSGGCVILAESALYLPTLPAKDDVTLINTVPSAIAELIHMGGVPESVKTVNLAGEALSESLVEQIYENTKVDRVYNLYGPTEDTTYSTYTLVRGGAPVTIGRPIANSQAYIVDSRLNPVPIGVPGQLYLAGEGLARGYYGRPDLTGERFVRNPFSWEAGARMYRTGDLARYLPDGSIEYLGRIDHQVKLRGFRIELGEIESALNGHPRVRQSVVLAREDAPGDKRLVAYVVPQSDAPLAVDSAAENSPNADLVADLRHWIAEKLPEFMMPSAFVVLDVMPLSPNGKVNRSALPEPERSRDETEKFVAPRNAVEEKLAEIWVGVLRVPKVGVRDNFFGIGGHSLLATQVVSRIRRWAHVELPLRAMFEAPTIAELALRVEHLQVDTRSLPSIRRAPRDRSLPLSFAQQRLWFLDQFGPDNPTYNIPQAMRLDGALHVESLRRALNEIIRRHEVLRTTYVFDGESPVQVIAPELKIDLPFVDLGNVPAESQEAVVRQMAIEYSRHVFRLDTGPLIRASLLRLGEQSHILLLNMHHIATDGWSTSQFSNELAPLYEAFLEGKPSPLPELPIQYADYAVWQRGWLRDEILDQQLSYWRKQLDGAPSALSLPADHLRPPKPSYRGSSCRVVYPRNLADKLNELGRREGATLFMTLMAAYQAVLFRYSGQEDFTVGSPIANRVHSDIENLIGYFVNTLVIRADLSGNPTFRELLERVRTAALGAYSNQDLPFEKLVGALRPQRTLDRNPLYQVMFVVQNAPRTAFQLSGLHITGMDVHNGTSKFDMAMFIIEKPEGLLCHVEYSTEVFEVSTIQRLMGHFRVLLEAIVEDPGRRVGELPLLTEEERQQILVDWNATQAEYPRDFCLHELIAKQAIEDPGRIAAQSGPNQMSYGELHKRSNQLAHFLQKRGVGPDVLVGLMVSRSLDLPVAILGVLKAGGAYVPLDPIYPKDRIDTILQDTSAPVILTDQVLVDALPESTAERIFVDTDWPSIAPESADDLPRSARPENLIYVLYTSGSTGKPKGVQIEHRNVVNFLASMQRKPGLAPDAVWVAVTTLSFDFSVLELFLPLLVGAKVVLASRDQAADPAGLLSLMAASRTTAVSATPATWRMLLESGWAGIPELKLFCGGEALTADLANQLLPRCSELWNVYGPTEVTVCSNLYRVTSEISQIAPIGVPNSNTTMFLLDSHCGLVPIGVPGELYIGGDGVARGYQNRPDLTAERFIANPFRPGERLYRSGDIASYMPDGNLRYHGRTDFQVKIRGFRIELGEIEAILGQHPAIKQCVVELREDVPGDTRLVGYIVPHPITRNAEECATEESQTSKLVPGLRRWLREKLPEFMTPSAFVVLDALPLSPNGKINRRALPAPEQLHEDTTRYVAPRTVVQQKLAEIWSEVLRVPDIGVHDDFFDLGGHSLSAVQVVLRIRQNLRVDLPVRVVFESPTLGGLSQEVEQMERIHLAPPIVPVPRDQRLPLSFAQQRLWVLDQIEPNNPLYNIPRAFRLTGKLNVAALESALNEIVARHELLRTTYTSEKGRPFQVIAPELKLPLPVVDLREFPDAWRENEARRLAREQALTPFDLAKDSVTRNLLLKLSGQDHILVLITHHIASDGWSTGILLRELNLLYEAALQGKPSPLPELPVQYADYAVWQRNWLQGEVLEQQVNYWKQRLQGAPPVLLLPTDRPRPAKPAFRGAIHHFLLPPSLADSIRTLSRQQGGTAFMTMLAAFQTLLLHYTNQTDIVLGTDLANRTTVQTESLIGFFVNLLALRTDLCGDPTFAELLSRVRDVALGAYAHQDLPFDKLVEELQPERSLSHNPVVQVLFVQQNTPRATFPMPGVEMRPFPLGDLPSKFDMVVFVSETDKGVAGTWLYNPDLFDAASIARMEGMYQLVLENATANPTLRLDQLAGILREQEQQHRASQHKEFQQLSSQKLKSAKRKTLR